MLKSYLYGPSLPKCLIAAIPEYWNGPIVPPNNEENEEDTPAEETPTTGE